MSRENAGPSLQPARPRLSLPIRGDVLSGSRTSGTASSQHLSTPSRPPACFLQPQSQWHSLTGPLRDPSVCACRRALSAKGPDSSPSGAAGDRTDRSTCTRLLRPPSTSRLCHGGPPVRLPTQGRKFGGCQDQDAHYSPFHPTTNDNAPTLCSSRSMEHGNTIVERRSGLTLYQIPGREGRGGTLEPLGGCGVGSR